MAASWSQPEEDAIRMEPTDPQKCITKGKSESFECRNHIKVIQPMGRGGERLYVCGTNAYNPRDYLLHANNMSLGSGDSAAGGGGPQLGVGGPAQAECPFDPEDNSTALWVQSGNPSDAPALYTGTATDFNRADPLIFRTELYNQTTGAKLGDAKRTSKFDSKWLDKPNFVGSFEIGDYVYFFFRESAVEYINCGKSIYSRVARLCKRDNGFKPHMNEKLWTTFLKARLNCSIPGEFPFYFDEIQSIYRNPYDERHFHAVFTTSNNGLTGSAICTFSLEAIQEAFNGKFKEQQSSMAAWLPVPSYKLDQNEPRPGSCVDDTLTFSDKLVTFTRGHPLMDSAVANDNNRPVFYRRDVMFTKIVVDVVEIDGLRYVIYFVGTNTGHVYKIVEWSTGSTTSGGGGSGMPFDGGVTGGGGGFLSALSDVLGGGGGGSNSAGGPNSNSQAYSSGPNSHAALVEVIEATVPEPVRAMEISTRHKSLYVASDSQVRQVNLLSCKQRHETCLACVRDPYCGWDRRHLECRANSPLDQPGNLIHDIANENPGECHAALKHKDVHVNWGQSVHLPCRAHGALVQEAQDLQALLQVQQRHAQAQLRNAPQPPATGGFYAHNNNNNNNNLAQQQQQQQQQMALMQQQQQLQMQQMSATGESYLAHAASSPAGQYVQWFWHRRDAPHSPGHPVLTRRDKYLLAADQGLVIMGAVEPGLFQCRLGNQILNSYNLIIDTKTCAAPSELEFRRIYADWCREIQRYKAAYTGWQASKNRCQAINANQAQQQQQQSQLMAAGEYAQQVAASQQQQQQPDGMWTVAHS